MTSLFRLFCGEMVFATTAQGISSLVPVLAGGVPLVVMIAFFWWDRRRRNEQTRSPQAEKLLRPPGHSLAFELDEVIDRGFIKFMVAFGLCFIAGLFFSMTAISPGIGSVIFMLVGFVLGCGGAYMSALTVKDLRRCQNLRLGLRGEQAVAEALQEVADCGYRSFHDFPGGEDWNIDHITVGPPGVFLIETKARNRVRCPKGKQPAHVLHVYEKSLRFPSGDDLKAIPQAERNARWLANYLTKKTGEKVEVEVLVVLPGWFIEIKSPPPSNTSVMNTAYLTGHLRRQPARLPKPQMQRIIAAIDEKCRDMEF